MLPKNCQQKQRSSVNDLLGRVFKDANETWEVLLGLLTQNKLGTRVQISQEAGQVVWYSHLLKNFPQFVVIYTVKGFGVVNKAEVDVFL